MSDTQPDFEVAVVGAGFSGIGTAIKLDEAGIDDWALLEEGDGVGGAWHWNTYPGIGVDIGHRELQVDDRLRRQSRHRGRTDVIDPHRRLPHRSLDPSDLRRGHPRPRRVVLDDPHRRVEAVVE